MYDHAIVAVKPGKGDGKLNWILGSFKTENVTEYDAQWRVPALNPLAAVPGSKDLYYQTDQVRAEEESAVFGEIKCGRGKASGRFFTRSSGSVTALLLAQQHG